MEQKEVDILIIGLGVAGFSAAIAAAEEGKKVLVIEKSQQAGGNAVQSNVGTICGAYFRNAAAIVPVEHPFLQHVVQRAAGKPIHHHKGLVVVPYEWKQMHDFIEEEIQAHAIEVWYDTNVKAVVVNGEVIKKMVVDNSGVETTVTAKNYIDCSGNGVVSQLAGLEMIRSDRYQAASQLFRVKGVGDTNEFALNLVLARAATHFKNEMNWPVEFLTLSVIPGSLHEGKVDLKFSLPEIITDQTDVNQLSEKGKAYVAEIFAAVKLKVDSLRDAEIEMIFSQAGVRVQQRSKGKHVLSEEEVLNCVKRKDEVAIGAWPIESWNDHGNVLMQYFLEGDYYSIPKGCLQSYKFDNLFLAGKNISASEGAIASARVIGTCIQTGYAAGKLAVE